MKNNYYKIVIRNYMCNVTETYTVILPVISDFIDGQPTMIIHEVIDQHGSIRDKYLSLKYYQVLRIKEI